MVERVRHFVRSAGDETLDLVLRQELPKADSLKNTTHRVTLCQIVARLHGGGVTGPAIA